MGFNLTNKSDNRKNAVPQPCFCNIVHSSFHYAIVQANIRKFKYYWLFAVYDPS